MGPAPRGTSGRLSGFARELGIHDRTLPPHLNNLQWLTATLSAAITRNSAPATTVALTHGRNQVRP
jgi:hypothetical protein